MQIFYKGTIFLLGLSVLSMFGIVYASHDESHASHELTALDVNKCSKLGDIHTIIFTDSGVNPASDLAHRCDTLIVQNRSSRNIELAFGPHEHHSYYPGLSHDPIEPGGQQSITLVDAGTFPVHDHYFDDHVSNLTIE